MNWILAAYSTGTTNRKLIRTNPRDGSWYYGAIDCESLQPDGIGAHYAENGTFIQGGFWEKGILTHSCKSQEEYEEMLR